MHIYKLKPGWQLVSRWKTNVVGIVVYNWLLLKKEVHKENVDSAVRVGTPESMLSCEYFFFLFHFSKCFCLWNKKELCLVLGINNRKKTGFMEKDWNYVYEGYIFCLFCFYSVAAFVVFFLFFIYCVFLYFVCPTVMIDGFNLTVCPVKHFWYFGR